jgi:iron complex outermembrane receptor protein
VPISLTALSGEELERMQAIDSASLGKVAPSLVMMRTGPFTQPILRGVGKRSTLGVENGVATYVDGVYLASSISALLDLRGIERVEVLNGPQGTLFGRNTTGGVIQVVTRDPSAASAGEIELTVGSYGYARGDAYLTGGTDQLAGNLAVSFSRNDGYGTNALTGKFTQGKVDHSFVARSKWVWRPTGRIKVTLAGDYQDIAEDFTQLLVARYSPIRQPRAADSRDSDQDEPNLHRFRYGGVSVRTDVEFGTVTLMSLSAVRRMNARYSADLDLGPQPLWSAAPIVDQGQFSQEFQLQSSGSSRLRWVAGAYYIHLDEQYAPTNFLYGGSSSSRLGGRVEQDLYDAGKVSSYAAYGQATLAIGDKTHVTGGVRYTIEDRSVRAQGQQLYDNPPFVRPIPGLPLLTQAPYRNSQTFREPTWRASLDRDLSNTVMAYVSASRGFQSGGWNLQTPQIPAFRPELLDAFEGGLKYASRSRRFSADASAFYYDYSELQVSAFTPLGSVTTNATSADIYGLDLQLQAQLSARTSLSFGGQLLRARYNAYPNATCTNFSPNAPVPFGPVSCDASGNRLPFAPDFKLNLGGDQEVQLGAGGTLVLSGNLAYNSGYFSEPDNVARQRAFATMDFAAQWRPNRGGLSVRVWVRNLANAHYYDSLLTFPTIGVLQRPAAPRRLGFSAGYAF